MSGVFKKRHKMLFMEEADKSQVSPSGHYGLRFKNSRLVQIDVAYAIMQTLPLKVYIKCYHCATTSVILILTVIKT
ncbi:hypothetical protein M8C21_029994 [Ambrosia artemisiifolia]|uniref:Uncharacterized protein n=1 Tax=Ambrosia artemisiifolia TaxID=4212 RepID=A0AAD5BS43_AMBAR|nr:hypothetical protein M8C21_029994 [Ambrosia artemisiifolia]